MTGFAGTLMNSSADLVTRVCQGDADAFRLIFERYSRPVISFIYDMVNDRGLAEELTQETFVRASAQFARCAPRRNSLPGCLVLPGTSPASHSAHAHARAITWILLTSRLWI